MHDALGGHPIFARLGSALDAASSPAAARAREWREAALERWETSDSPLVHRLQDVSDAVFAETEMAQALREVREEKMRGGGVHAIFFA
jgi:import inner membrane translocase subunit TIM44